jgi:hypothetical protein
MATKSPLVRSLVLLLLATLLVTQSVPAIRAAGLRSTVVVGSLQAAVDAAIPGDILLLRQAVYAEQVTIRRSGTAAAPITLAGAGVGQSIVRGGLRLQGAAFWHIQDLDVDATGDAVRLEAPAQDIQIQRVQFYNGHGYGVRVGNDTANVLIEDCAIHHFDAGTEDAHGIGIMTARNVTIRRCDIHDNSGDAIQSNTSDYPGYGRFASDVLIEHNLLHHNHENAVDIKSTHSLTARYNQMWGFTAVSSSAGMAVQVQYDAQNITIAGNQIWDATEGIEVSRGTKNGVVYPLAPQHVMIDGNLLHDIGIPHGEPGGNSGRFHVYLPLTRNGHIDSGTGSGIIVRASTDVKVYNNTVLRAAQYGVYLATAGGAHPSGVDLRNNVLEGGTDDLTWVGDPVAVTGLIVDYNHYVSRRIGGRSLDAWLARGYERHATSGDPQLDVAMLPRPDSVLHDSGIDVGLPFSGVAPDRGWGKQ